MVIYIQLVYLAQIQNPFYHNYRSWVGKPDTVCKWEVVVRTLAGCNQELK